MFDYDQAELTDAGKQALEQILPIYCKVLLQDDYMKYLAEIIIDGYTDTDGDYSYNLQLSQQRSLAVAQYLLDIQGLSGCHAVTESGKNISQSMGIPWQIRFLMQTEM